MMDENILHPVIDGIATIMVNAYNHDSGGQLLRRITIKEFTGVPTPILGHTSSSSVRPSLCRPEAHEERYG